MKTRLGFVSNSSSSSFVVLGFTVPKGSVSQEEVALKLGMVTEEKIKEWKYLEDEVRELFYKRGSPYYCEESGDGGAPKGRTLIGITIADVSNEEGLQEKEINFNEILTQAEELRIKLGIEIPLRLYTGTRAC